MNFRRLPMWVLSRAQHVSRWGIHPDYKPIPMDPPEKLAESPFPDSRIEIFTDEGRIRIDRWLRTESITEDFLGFISEFTDVTDDQRKQVREVDPVNTHDYDKDVMSWFTPDLIERMYAANPRWAGLEREILRRRLPALGGAVELAAESREDALLLVVQRRESIADAACVARKQLIEQPLAGGRGNQRHRPAVLVASPPLDQAALGECGRHLACARFADPQAQPKDP